MAWRETAPVNNPKVLGASEGTVSTENDDDDEEGEEEEEAEDWDGAKEEKKCSRRKNT